MTCRGCWWAEGGACYLEPVNRLPDGRSTKLAIERCSGFKSKRAVYDANLRGIGAVLAEEVSGER